MLATISHALRFSPASVSHWRTLIRPSTITGAPLWRHVEHASAVFSHVTMSRKSVSFFSFVPASMAMLNLQTAFPLGMYFSSGSRVRRPTRMDLL